MFSGKDDLSFDKKVIGLQFNLYMIPSNHTYILSSSMDFAFVVSILAHRP